MPAEYEAPWRTAHLQIRRLSGIGRWMVGTWLIHYPDLAKTYLDARREKDMGHALRQLPERPAVEPVDRLRRQEAQDLLRRG